MTLTTTTLFWEEVEYPKTNLNDTDQNQEQVQENIADTLTGNLFLQDFVDSNKSEISYLFQSE